MWIEVFKSGTHTDNKGNQNTYDIDSLAQIATNYNEKIKNSPNLKMPLLNGHNQESEKLGLINQLILNNDKLMADIDITDSNTLKKIIDNQIQNVSLALNGFDISHIGLLENELPAIDDLKPIQETIDITKIEEKHQSNDINKLMQDFAQINNNLSPIGKELANNIISNLKEVPQEVFQIIRQDFLKFIDDLNKSYLTREYSQFKSEINYQYEIKPQSTFTDRHLLHLEITNQLRKYPDLSYEQALLKIIQ